MNTKEDHLNYIKVKGNFKVDCSHQIFTQEELKILEKFGHWFQALASGVLEPISDEQLEFIKVVNKEKLPITIAENAWFKYMGRKAYEQKAGDSLNAHYQPESDTFHNREMAKKQKRMMFSEISRNHKM